MHSFIKKIANHFSFSSRTWIGAAFGMLLASTFLYLSYIYDLTQNDVNMADALIYFVVGLIAIAMLSACITLVFVIIASFPVIYQWSLVFFAWMVYYFFVPYETTEGVASIGLFTIISFSVMGGSLGYLLSFPKRNFARGCFALMIGTIGVLLLFVWLIGLNTAFEPSDTIYRAKANQLSLQVSNPSIIGPFKVSTICYGPAVHRGKKLVTDPMFLTETVDGSPFINGWDGVDGWLRTRYWGFDMTKLPLSGCVWYPQGDGPFPLVMIVHGNHEMSASSEKGYEYLGALWASRGFIAVSVDENFLNGSWTDLFNSLNEMPARGWLILENLALWRHWNEQEGHPFYHKVDLEKIALVGHSRGGEAIATATAFNRLEYYPGDGNIRFDYNFNIKALAAIAPVDGQYIPGGMKVELNDVDYFVMYGSHDADVRAFQGAAQYHRIGFTGNDYHFKSALYIYGANHGQFNTLWGSHDTGWPTITMFDLSELITPNRQQEIAKIYLTAFLEASLRGNKGYLPLFHFSRYGQQWLPETHYFNEFADSTFQYVEAKKTDIDIAATTLPGGVINGYNLAIWSQSRIILKDGTQLNPETFIGWDRQRRDPTYEITMPDPLPKDFILTPSDTLVMTIANSNNEAVDPDEMIDFTIELIDHQGNKAQLLLSSFDYLHPVIRANTMKAVYIDPLQQTEPVFQTFEFPLSEFIKNNQAFDVTMLKSITFVFNKSPVGLIILNSLAFAKKVT